MNETLAYAAGIVDGEGSVMLQYASGTDRFRSAVVSVASTSPELLDFLKENFGGRIRGKPKYKDYHKDSYQWDIRNNDAVEFLTNIRPYLREKEKVRRTDLLLNVLRPMVRRNGKYTAEETEKRLEFERLFRGA